MITGGNSGLGKATARTLAEAGAHVFIASRSRDRSMPVVEHIREAAGHNHVEFLRLDLARLDTVWTCARAFLDRDLPLHLLVNNAAVFGHGLTEDGFELNFGVNHLGHFLLTHLLLDRLKESAPARVLTVAGHKVRHIHSGEIDFEAVRKTTSSYTALPE
jgi:retinol dehydrogenase-12